MAQSCDTVFYEIGLRLYRRRLEELQAWARRFGLGSKTRVDLPSEVQGRVPDAAWKKAFNRRNPQYGQWMPGDTVNVAIGQGDVLVTPLQLVSFYGAIANGGTFHKPHVMRRIVMPDGHTAHPYEPTVVRRLKARRESLSVVQEGLRRVILEGTGRGAFEGFDVEVSGKTGTAQVAGKDDFAWFVAYAPSSKPKYVAMVMVEQGGHGGSVAAPAVRNIFATIYGLPRTDREVYDESR
jgi:penicillin-binding protein 2